MNPLRYLLVVVLSIALAGAAVAAKKEAPKKDAPAGAKAKKGSPLIGEVVGIDGSNLKIAPKGKEVAEVIIATDANTVVELDEKPAKLSDLAKGQRVRVFPAAGTAQKIVATSPKAKKAPATRPATGPAKKPDAPAKDKKS